MPEEASMSFKVYLDLGGGKQEVRRFGLPETVATNYSVLREKVCSIFGVANQDAVLSWKDAEGDSITISSDDELMEAVADCLSKQNLQLVRINVGTRTEAGSSARQAPQGLQDFLTAGNQQGEVHPAVTCDGCNGRVQGFRYKCVTCTDFDLCGACETKGMHKEHRMMRLPKPQDAGGPWFFWKEKEDAPGQYSTMFGMHGGDAAGGGFSSSTSFSGGAGAGAGSGGTGGWWGFGGPRGRHCHRRGHGPRGRGWPGWWGRNWGGKNWAGCAMGQTMNSECGSQQQKQQSSQQSQQQQSQQQQSQQQQSQQQQAQQQQAQQQQSSGGCPWMSNEGAAFPFTGEESDMPSPEQVAEEAKHMAEHMAQQAAQQAHHFATHYASDHLANVMRGIWTAWSGQQGANNTTSSSSSHSHSYSSSVSGDGPQQNASIDQDKSKEAGHSKEPSHAPSEEYLRSVGETVANILDPLGIDVEVAVEHNGIRQRCSLGENIAPSPQSNASPAPTSPAREPESTGAQGASGGSVNMEVQTDCPTGPSAPQESDKDEEVMDIASPCPRPSLGDGEQMEGHTGSPEPEDWMLVNQEASSDSATSDAVPKVQQEEARVSYPSLAELTPHPDPKIQRALEHMSAMGYSNEGGWLTNILEMKQGDINQVLDLLQPVNK